MAVLEARTDVHRSPEVVFDALCDLRQYEAYSDHLATVDRTGDGGVGTRYTLRFRWRLVSHTVRSRVTAIDRPVRLDFEVTDGIDATGSWHVEPRPDGASSDGPTEMTRVRFVVRYDPDTVAGSALQLPSLASMSWVVDRAAPLVEREAERVVTRVVQELEGSEREVDLAVSVR